MGKGEQAKETTGIWFQIDLGLKDLVDFMCRLSGKTRKDYVLGLVEDDMYRRLSSIPGIEESLASFDTNIPGSNHLKAYQELKERALAKEVVGVAVVSENLSASDE